MIIVQVCARLSKTRDALRSRRPVLEEAAEVAIVLLAYLAIGCAFYMNVEHWNLVDALYFLMVTMSTVGYGDFSPSTAVSKVFTVFYVVIGIGYIFVRLSNFVADIGFRVERAIVSFVRGLLMAKENVKGKGTGQFSASNRSTSRSKMVDIDGDGSVDYVMPMGAVAYWVQGYTFNVVVFVVLQLVSAYVFTALLNDDSGLPGLGFGDAIYHCLITSTTVGYGDIELWSEGARLFACLHILLSVSWLGASISQFAELLATREAQLAEFELLKKSLDETSTSLLKTA